MMNSTRSALLAGLAFLFFQPRFLSASSDVIIDSVMIGNDELTVSYHLPHLLDEKAVSGLQNGFTTLALHQIVLWKRSGLFSRQIAEVVYTMHLSYDRWEQRYVSESEGETYRTKTISQLIKHCSVLNEKPVCAMTRLTANAGYYLSVNVTLQPVSPETYKEIHRWLSRNQSQADSLPGPEPQRGQFFSMLLNVLGFGDRYFSVKSADFIFIAPNRIKWREK